MVTPRLICVQFISLFPGNPCLFSVCGLSSPAPREVQSLGLLLLAILNGWWRAKGRGKCLGRKSSVTDCVLDVCCSFQVADSTRRQAEGECPAAGGYQQEERVLHIKHTNVSVRDMCQCCIMRLGIPFKHAESGGISSLQTWGRRSFSQSVNLRHKSGQNVHIICPVLLHESACSPGILRLLLLWGNLAGLS